MKFWVQEIFDFEVPIELLSTKKGVVFFLYTIDSFLSQLPSWKMVYVCICHLHEKICEAWKSAIHVGQLYKFQVGILGKSTI